MKQRLQGANSWLEKMRTGRSGGLIPKVLGRDLEDIIWGGPWSTTWPMSLH